MDNTPWDNVQPATALGPGDSAEGVSPPAFKAVKSTSAWTIPLICAGIALIACCVLIPAADENRQLTYEAASLRADLKQIENQVQTNEEFLTRMRTDPALAERLAQRQLKMVREGTNVLELKGHPLRASPSPFLLVTLPPPAPLAPYRPVAGELSAICRDPHLQLYLIGAGMMMIAMGLVLSQVVATPASRAI